MLKHAKTSFVSSSPQSAAARSRQLLPPAFGIAWLPPGSHQGCQGRRVAGILWFSDGASAFPSNSRTIPVDGPWWRKMSAEASNVRSSVPSYTAKQLECLGMLGAHILTVLHFKCSADHPEVSRKAQSPVAGCWRFKFWMENSVKSPCYNQSAASFRAPQTVTRTYFTFAWMKCCLITDWYCSQNLLMWSWLHQHSTYIAAFSHHQPSPCLQCAVSGTLRRLLLPSYFCTMHPAPSGRVTLSGWDWLPESESGINVPLRVWLNFPSALRR